MDILSFTLSELMIWAIFLSAAYPEETPPRKCSYTLVVNEVNRETCPQIVDQLRFGHQTDRILSDDPKSGRNAEFQAGRGLDSAARGHDAILTVDSDPGPPQRLGEQALTHLSNKVIQLESQLKTESLKTNQLESYIRPLKSLHGKLSAFEPLELASSLNKLEEENKALMKENKEFKEQYSSLEKKLANLMLDLNSLHKQFEKRLSEAGLSVLQKSFPVQSVVDSCRWNNQGRKGRQMKYRDCAELFTSGHNKSGVFFITPLYSSRPIPVWCDMDTSGGGWLIFQRRQDEKVKFSRGWDDYRHGFGDVVGNHWLGNENLFMLTNQKEYRLRVDVWDFYGNRLSAEYMLFKVDGERDQYQLSVGNHTGPLPDGLTAHHGVRFSTPDRDNDVWPGYHCAKEWQAGWWFTNCWFSFLNGEYYKQSRVKYRGIAWNAWKSQQLRKSEMKMRPVSWP